MPHDRNGKALSVGDRVRLEAQVSSIVPCEDACNVELQVLGDTEHLPVLSCNGRLTELQPFRLGQLVIIQANGLNGKIIGTFHALHEPTKCLVRFADNQGRIQETYLDPSELRPV